MSASQPSSLKLSDQRWYQNSTSNMSMYMSNNNFNTGSGSMEVATNYGTIPITGTVSTTTGTSGSDSAGNKNAPYRKSSNINNSAVERLLPELLVMELHRDMNNAVTYRHYTIRGLYRYVLDAIADRTGVLQAAACYQVWQKKTIGMSRSRDNKDDDVNGENLPNTEDDRQPTTSTGSMNDAENSNTSKGVIPVVDDNNNGKHTTVDLQSNTVPTVNIGSSGTSTVLQSPDYTPSDLAPPSKASESIDTDTINATTTDTGSGGLAGISTLKSQDNPPNPNTGTNVTYRERLGGYLHPRDMRRLVTPFSTSNEPEIIVRRHVILINYDPLRTIILRDRILVLVPNGADSLLSKLESRVRGNSTREDMENAIFGTNTDNTTGNSIHDTTSAVTASTVTAKVSNARTDRGFLSKKNSSNTTGNTDQSNADAKSKSVTTDRIGDNDDDDADTTAMDEWHEMAAREWVNLPFELQCTDAVLNVVGSILQEETIEVQTAAQTFIERIVKHGGAGLQDDPLTIIRVVKDAVQLMSNRVKSFIQSIQRLLDDDEDMALMNLSRLLSHPERFVQPVPQRILNEESDEPELILEGNLQIGLTLVNYLDVIQGQIHTAKELIDQRLDATRNKLLFANMLISVFTLCVTLGALIGSFFGMNLELPNNLAENDFAFNRVVAYTCIGCFIICVLIMIALLYTDTIPFRLSRPFRPVRINVHSE